MAGLFQKSLLEGIVKTSAVVEQTLEQADMTIHQVDGIAVTYAPGLIGALLVGVNYAKGVGFGCKQAVNPTHHLRSHIAANYLAHPDLKPPFCVWWYPVGIPI